MLKSAARTLDLYAAFARVRRPLTLSELAREIGVAPSSCSGLIGTLRERGYLYAVGERRAVYPTRRMMEQALLIAESEPQLAGVAPLLARLSETTRETAIFGRRQGDAVIYLNVVEGPQTVRYTARAGDTKPLHSSAIGKVVLAALERGERRALLKRLPRPRITPATLCDPDKIDADIAAGIRRGYQATHGENVADVAAIAMPCRIGGNLFGIAIAAPIHRMSVDKPGHVAALRAAVAELESLP